MNLGHTLLSSLLIKSPPASIHQRQGVLKTSIPISPEILKSLTFDELEEVTTIQVACERMIQKIKIHKLQNALLEIVLPLENPENSTDNADPFEAFNPNWRDLFEDLLQYEEKPLNLPSSAFQDEEDFTLGANLLMVQDPDEAYLISLDEIIHNTPSTNAMLRLFVSIGNEAGDGYDATGEHKTVQTVLQHFYDGKLLSEQDIASMVVHDPEARQAYKPLFNEAQQIELKPHTLNTSA